MSSEPLIQVENVCKKFCRGLKKSLLYGVQDISREVLGLPAKGNELRPDEFWAVSDISFELRRGESLGLIGRNGAGKTTLLKMLNGLIKPDTGQITMRGRVGALIALGAGFNPVLTGRENIYVNAAVLGLSKREIEAKIDEIIDFAEVGEFIDTPVQSYSSGMQVRLGFAIATALQPDVLLLDEVLAVGDAAFRNKCYRRVVAMRKQAAVIFVSHNMDQVSRVCDQTLVMSKGRPIHLGGISEGVDAYERVNDEGEDQDKSFLSINRPVESFQATLSEIRIKSGAPLSIMVRIVSAQVSHELFFRVWFYNASGAVAADGTYNAGDYGLHLNCGQNLWSIVIDSVPLKQGRYRLAFNLIDRHGDLIVWSFKQHELRVDSTYAGAFSDCQLKLKSWSRINQS